MDVNELAEIGRTSMRRVFSNEYVQKRASSEGGFNEGFREYGDLCMGAVWGRPGLDLRTRRFVTMSVLAAQNRIQPLSLHLESALRSDCTVEELKELIIHLAFYCGIPTATAANQALESICKNSPA